MIYDLLLKNACIIDEEGSISKNNDIYVQNGIIAKISTQQNETFSAKEKVDCEELFVTPGLVNLHTHSPMTVFRGMAEDVHIDDWFNKIIWPYESRMNEKDAYAGTIAAIEEMINNGVTAFADHYMFADSICDAAIEMGIKADIAPTLFGVADEFDRNLEEVSQLILKRQGLHNRIHLRMGPHSPYTCPGKTLKNIVDRAKSLEVGIHIHVSETLRQVEESLDFQSMTPFEVIEEAGGFQVPCILAHGLWITDEDRKRLNKQTYFAVSPKTYMKLSMGAGHIWENSNELPLCTGTDGAASSNTLNPLEQARIYALVGKMVTGSSTDFDLQFVWKMLMRGHGALSFNSGKIKEGYAADLVVWDLAKCNTFPIYDPLASLIYGAESGNILHTIIDGKFLKKEGEVQIKSDRSSLLNRSEDIIGRGKGESNLKF